jgi:heterodisulfide reductase subunit A-like polyferredoxin
VNASRSQAAEIALIRTIERALSHREVRHGTYAIRASCRDPTPQKKVDTRIPDNPSVAIIGGGISGLVCASRLSDKGIHATVFDTGKNAVGGRLATRYLVRAPPCGQDGNHLGLSEDYAYSARRCCTRAERAQSSSSVPS